MQFSRVHVEMVSAIVKLLEPMVSPSFVRASPFMVSLIMINGCIESSSIPSQWKQTDSSAKSKALYWFISLLVNFCVVCFFYGIGVHFV